MVLLEANPSPAFTYYEQATGQPIATAVARLLADATTTPKTYPPGTLPARPA